MNRPPKGFSLVEILIVVLLLSILAMVVVPRVNNASTDARDRALETNLKLLREQIELYKSEHWGRGPHLNGQGQPSAGNFVARMTGKTDPSGRMNPNGECGPYVAEWPVNPFAPKPVAGKIKFGPNPIPPRDDSSGWYFCITDGIMHVNTSDGAKAIDP